MKRYVLKRTLPDDTVRRHSPQVSARLAAVSAGHLLYDNARVPKAEAQEFANRLLRIPRGEELAHAGSGYRFVIEMTEE